ncbi:MAG: hypothetical protein QF755_05265 [Candidatus Peribacteraceae bacterium]|jgi:hypothetical protein|nr:hypothetical protein [Candidatus Peribacteraceae bacterium]|tara:strand:+ start:1752 stop:1910 length:159 start_codon:yes stop_codon:yes gene_type:complete
MSISDSELATFIEIIKDDYGIKLTPEEARGQAEGLINFSFKILKTPQLPRPP